jgi:hypothetical protein
MLRALNACFLDFSRRRVMPVVLYDVRPHVSIEIHKSGIVSKQVRARRKHVVNVNTHSILYYFP